MAIAARKGHHSLLKWFHEQGCPWDQNCCAAAARGGHLDVLMWLKDQGCPFKTTPTLSALMSMTNWLADFHRNNPSPDSNLAALQVIKTEEEILRWENDSPKRFVGRTGVKAAKGGHLKLLQWAMANDFPVGKPTIAAAAKGGHLDIIKWLVERGCEWDEWALESAANRGHLDVIQWLVEAHPNDVLSRSEFITLCAAEGGHLHVLKRLREKGVPLALPEVFSISLQNGQLEVAKWLREIGMELGPYAIDEAAGSGDLETLKWVREHGCQWSSSTFGWAASNGGWDVLKWLREQGCPWGDGAIWGAAQKGRIDVVKWLRDQGCPWDDRASLFAARAGHFEMLKRLKEQGCPGFDTILPGYSDMLSFACEGGFLDIAIWAKENGCHEHLDDINYCRLAAEGGHLNILKWLREQGFPWDWLTTFGAGAMGRSGVFFWAIENGCPLGRPLARTNEQI